jgi:Flp pilus assembly protein TadD
MNSLSESLAMNRWTCGFLMFASLSVLVSTNLGCGNRSMPASSIQEREKAFDDAVAKLAAKDYLGAREAASIALKGGGLSADQTAEASMIIIEAATESGDFAIAESEIKAVEPNVLDMVKFHILQGRLAKRQGNDAAAQEAFGKARAIDPNAPIPN